MKPTLSKKGTSSPVSWQSSPVDMSLHESLFNMKNRTHTLRRKVINALNSSHKESHGLD